MNVSIVILSKNEADTIARCVTSVKWCDDVLLLDDSEDQTVKIAKQILPTIQVIPCHIQDDFAKIRNLGLTHAKHDWVLFLDADEEVSIALKEEIREVLDSALLRSNNMQGYFVKRKDYFLGIWLQFGETGEIKLLKLARKDAGKWERRVHEVWKIRGTVGILHSPLFHYPHPTITEFLDRINRWTTLDAQEFFDQGVRSAWWKIIAYPGGKFIRNYFVKQGYRDGMPGLLLSLMMSFHSFLTRAKLFMLQMKQ